MAYPPDHWFDAVVKLFRAFTFRRTLLVGFPVVLILLLTGSVYWLLHTSNGAAWVWNRVEGLAGFDISASQVKGDLAGGFLVQDLTYRADGFDLKVRKMEVQAGPGWWPPTIEVRKLFLQDVDIFVHAEKSDVQKVNEDFDMRSVLASIQLPVPLEIRDAALTGINLRQEGDPSVMVLGSVRFGMSLDDQLVVEHLDIVAPGFETGLQGYLALAPPFGLSIDAGGRFEKSVGAGGTVLTLPFKLESTGDLDDLKFKLTSSEHGLQIGGDIRDALDRQQWDISAALDDFELPEEMTGQAISLSGLRLVSQGDILNWSFELESMLHTARLQDARVVISGAGNTSGVEITNAVLTGPGLDVGVSGQLDWSAQTQAVVKAVIRKLDLSPWLPDWPAGEQLTGELDLSWSGKSLRIPAGRLSVDATRTSVDIEADIDIEANRVEARLDWSNLQWPLAGDTIDFASQSGHLDVGGSVDDWLAAGQLDVRVGDYPQGHFEIKGDGNRTSGRFFVPGGEILGGSISGEAGADWADDLNWDAVIQAKGINPGPILTEWPGRLDTRFKIMSQDQPRRVKLELETLKGLLRDVPVTARGGLEVTDSGLAFDALEVHTDEALLELNGAMADSAGMHFTFNGLLPSEILQGARGNVQLEGRFSSFAADPLLDLQLQASDLSWNGFSIGELAVSTPATETAGPLPALQLDATSLSWKHLLLDDLSLGFSPTGENVEIKVVLTDKEIVLKSMLTLTPEDRNAIFTTGWRGVFSGFDVDTGPAYHFGLLKPAAFVLTAGRISLEPVCLSETTGASLCLDFDDQGNGDWSLVADATAVPVDYLRDILGLDVHFEQLLEGHMEWRQLHGQAPTGGAEFSITAGRILDLLDDEVLAQTKEGRFAFTLQNGNLESGVLNIEFPGTGFVDVNFEILDLVGDGQQQLQGHAVTHLDRLKFIGQLVLPGIDAVDGQFDSDIRIGGSLKNPEFDGDFKFSNGLIDYVPVGLKLEDIAIEGQLVAGKRGDFTGRFKAGEGIGSFEGQLLFNDAGGAQLELDLKGGPLLLVNTDALKIHTDTELKFMLSPDRVDINGHITIPEARLTPENVQLGEVNDSEDLVIVNKQEQSEPDSQNTSAQHRFYGQLEVTLGDDVFVKVPGIETHITGSTRFKWSGEPMPVAEGAYTVRGKVDIYGPTLRISNGTVSFPGVPADNPNLNIRAGRQIYGNTQIRTAGVQMIGTLKHPVLEAYTVPITNEDRAWTLLVTGTDFDQAQGVSGFDLGTYIMPKLYVSYGISLFENENVISARYDLKKGFGVKVTSGQRETGLDVSYTIDR